MSLALTDQNSLPHTQVHSTAVLFYKISTVYVSLFQPSLSYRKVLILFFVDVFHLWSFYRLCYIYLFFVNTYFIRLRFMHPVTLYL
jgi:hypothetical protein